jgi:hypothetical protein
VQDRDARRLKGVEKTDSIDIHEIDLLQIQRYSWSATLDFRLQLVKVLTSKLPAQANERPALTRNPLDLQRHKSPGPKHTRSNAISRPFAICWAKRGLAMSATVKVRRSVKFHRDEIESRRNETEVLKAEQL